MAQLLSQEIKTQTWQPNLFGKRSPGLPRDSSSAGL